VSEVKLKKRYGLMRQTTARRIRATAIVNDDVAVRVWPSGRISGEIPFMKLDRKQRFLGKVMIPFTGTLQEA
jgi:hypothetical protein